MLWGVTSTLGRSQRGLAGQRLDGEDVQGGAAEAAALAATYFFRGWRATIVPPPGSACCSALSQMLAITR